MEAILNTLLLSIIATLLGIIVNYIKKMVDKFEVMRDKVLQHDAKFEVNEIRLDNLEKQLNK